MAKRLRILSARSSVLLIGHRTRVGVWGGTTAVGNTPAVQADDAAAANRLHRQGAVTSGAASGRRGAGASGRFRPCMTMARSPTPSTAHGVCTSSPSSDLASVLASGRRLYLDTAGVVLWACGRVLGRDTLTESPRLAVTLWPRAPVLTVVGAGLGPGLSARKRQSEDAAMHHQPLLGEPPRVVRQLVALADIFDLRCDL
jgi:hypothetical protein